MGDWMMTHTGKHVDPLNVRQEDICLEDIAFALSNLTRFGGHVRFLSVAEHCIRVCREAPPELQRAALLHEAAEAYIGDIIRPLKRSIQVFEFGPNEGGETISEVEKRIMFDVIRKWGMPFDHEKVIEELDYIDCIAAGVDAWGPDAVLQWHRGPELLLKAMQWRNREPFQHWSPCDAEAQFQMEAYRLGIK